MEVFSSEKGKVVFWSYLIISLIVFLCCAFFLDGYDKIIEEKNPLFKPKPKDAFLAANFFLAIPLSYIIMIGFVVVKYKNHRAKLNNYRKFEDYSIEFQEEELSQVFCENCKSYPGASFTSGKMERGMRIIYTTCKKCQQVNKHRIT